MKNYNRLTVLSYKPLPTLISIRYSSPITLTAIGYPDSPFPVPLNLDCHRLPLPSPSITLTAIGYPPKVPRDLGLPR